MNSLARPTALIVLALALTACGGGGSGGGSSSGGPAGDTQGVLLDERVAGVKWQAQPSGGSGQTGANGGFVFAEGDTVTFSVDGVTLGEASPDELALATRGEFEGKAVVTPEQLGEGAMARAVNMTQFVRRVTAFSVSDRTR